MKTEFHYLISPLIALTVTVICIQALKPLAIHIGLLDHPNVRKLHKGKIPLIGGIAMFLGFLFALLIQPVSLLGLRGLLAATFILIFMGIFDDFREISATVRLVIQLLVAFLIATWGETVLHSLGPLFFFKEIYLGYWSIPLTIVAITGVINATNMTDGMDGFAGGLAFNQFLLMLMLAIRAHKVFDEQLLLIMMSALLGFLYFNFRLPHRKKAVIFMGDAGSMFLGLMLSWFAIRLSQGSHPAAPPITFLWIMALPLLDILAVMIRRVSKGQSPFQPDRYHLHHVLQSIGKTAKHPTALLLTISLGLGILGILGTI